MNIPLASASASLPSLLRSLLGWLHTFISGFTVSVLAFILGPYKSCLLIRPYWSKALLEILDVHVHLQGEEYLTGPAIFVSNHESLIDSVILPSILPPNTCFIAKKDLHKIPFMSTIIKAGGAILIDRRKPQSAIMHIHDALQKMPKGWSLMLFPEGTRSPVSGRLQPFKKGVFHMARATKLPIVPIGICGTHEVLAKGEWLAKPRDIYVNIGKPLASQHWQSEEINLHLNEVRNAVLSCLEKAQKEKAAYLELQKQLNIYDDIDLD